MTEPTEKTTSTIGEDQQHVTRSAGIVGFAVMGSRLLGLIREMVIAYFFTSGVSAAAFYAAFRIPNLMRDLFGEGVLSKAFVTTFTATELEDGEEAAWRLANRVFHLIALTLAAITVVGIVAAPLIVNVMFPGEGFDLELEPDEHFGFTNKRDLTVYLTRIMFPFLPLVSFAAIAMGLLNSKGKFGIPSSASSFFNLGSVVVGIGGYYASQSLGLHPVTGMAVGVLVGGALQLLIQVPSMWRVGFRYRPTISFRDARIRQVMRLLGPAILGATALQINVFVNSQFASLDQEWVTWIERAYRLMHLPIGIFGASISIAALPNLAKLVVADDLDGYRQAFSHSLRLVMLMTIPASIGLMMLDEPICRLIFERGKTTAIDTQQTAPALFYYAFGLCGFAAVKIATDGFYAFNDTRTPVKVSLCTIALNIILNALFIFGFNFDHRSLALSTSCTITLNFLTLLVLLWRRVGGFGLGKIVLLLVKILVVSAGMGGVCWWVNLQLEGWLGVAGVIERLIGVFVPVVVGLGVLVGGCRLLRVQEFDGLLRAILRR